MSDDKPSYADTLEGQMIIEMVSAGEFLIDAATAVGLSEGMAYYKIRTDERFREEMERARELGYDAQARNTFKVAKGVEGFSTGDVKRDTLICKQTNHMLSKWHPKKYGEKLEIEQKTATVAIPVSDDPIAAQQAYEKLLTGR